MSLNDEEQIGTEELASDGTTSIFSGATVVSTTAATKVVVLSGVDLFRPPEQLENGDKITLAGTTGGADGDYTVDEVVDLTSFKVQEAIADSTGGTCDAKLRSGAKLTGLDPTGFTQTSATNVQDALSDLDGAIAGGGITEGQHEALDTLAHELTETHDLVVTRDGNNKVQTVLAEAAGGGADIRKLEILTRSGGKVATYRETQYEGDGTTVKRQLDVTVNRSGGKATSLNVVRTT